MKQRAHWHDAQLAAASLEERGGDRRTLLLLTRLPFVYAKVIEHLSGLRGGASVYRSLHRLAGARLVATIRPPLRPGHVPRLHYLTDLGIATVALDQGVDPEDLARRNRLRGRDLLALLPELPQLMAAYELLGMLAAAGRGRPDLLAWERPWRRRYQRPTAKAPVSVALPAYAAFAWGSAAGAYLLLPDLGGVPLHVYRTTLGHLLLLRSLRCADFPTLVIATSDLGRVAAWRDLIEEVRRARREAPLAACVTTWHELRADPEALGGLCSREPLSGTRLIRQLRLRPLRARHAASSLPELVGEALAASGSSHGAGRLGPVALGLGAADRRLLDHVGRHSFLPIERLTALLGWEPKWTRERRNRLIDAGLMRLVPASEVGAEAAAAELVELTAGGLALVAAQHGLSPGAAVRHLGLAGGGPGHPFGARRKLLANLAHTIGADAMFVSLVCVAKKLAALGSDDALVEWRNAAACSRRYLRPDGYGLYRHAGRLYGFFLEYDRGTMSARDYHAKFAAYHGYMASGRFERDYDGFPTILVVTAGNSAEERIARAARAAAVGRGGRLPILLTCEWRIHASRNPYGLLAPIWREPDAGFDERRLWPLNAPSVPALPTSARFGCTVRVAEPSSSQRVDKQRSGGKHGR